MDIKISANITGHVKILEVFNDGYEVTHYDDHNEIVQSTAERLITRGLGGDCSAKIDFINLYSDGVGGSSNLLLQSPILNTSYESDDVVVFTNTWGPPPSLTNFSGEVNEVRLFSSFLGADFSRVDGLNIIKDPNSTLTLEWKIRVFINTFECS